ncbi:MAG: hypothetical protein ACXVCY_04635 [Pseudobdellovibrionaceae bacterium]
MKRIFTYNLLTNKTQTSDVTDAEELSFIANRTADPNEPWGKNQETLLPTEIILPAEVLSQSLGIFSQIVTPEQTIMNDVQKMRYLLQEWFEGDTLTPAQMIQAVSQQDYFIDKTDYLINNVWVDSVGLTPDQIATATDTRTFQVTKSRYLLETWYEGDTLTAAQIATAINSQSYTIQVPQVIPAVTRPVNKFTAEYVYWVVDVTAEYDARRRAGKNANDREFGFQIIDMMKDANVASGITSTQTIAFVNEPRIITCILIIITGSIKALKDHIVGTDFSDLFNSSQKTYIVAAIDNYLIQNP